VVLYIGNFGSELGRGGAGLQGCIALKSVTVSVAICGLQLPSCHSFLMQSFAVCFPEQLEQMCFRSQL
jgi:hypothetical protein